MNDPAVLANLKFRTSASAVATLLALALTVAAADGNAASNSAAIHGSKPGSAAQLEFKIIIPTVLILDTRSGVVYSNDRRTVALLGTSARRDARNSSDLNASAPLASDMPIANAAPGASGLPPVAAPNGWSRATARSSSSSRVASRGFANGDVVCIP